MKRYIYRSLLLLTAMTLSLSAQEYNDATYYDEQDYSSPDEDSNTVTNLALDLNLRLNESSIRIRSVLSERSQKELSSILNEFLCNFAEIVRTSKKVEANPKTIAHLEQAVEVLVAEYKEKVKNTISDMRRNERIVIQEELDLLVKHVQEASQEIREYIDTINPTRKHRYIKYFIAGCIDVTTVIAAMFIADRANMINNKEVIYKALSLVIPALWIIVKPLTGQSIGDFITSFFASDDQINYNINICMSKALILLITSKDINID